MGGGGLGNIPKKNIFLVSSLDRSVECKENEQIHGQVCVRRPPNILYPPLPPLPFWYHIICLKLVLTLSQNWLYGVPKLSQSCVKVVSKLSQSCPKFSIQLSRYYSQSQSYLHHKTLKICTNTVAAFDRYRGESIMIILDKGPCFSIMVIGIFCSDTVFVQLNQYSQLRRQCCLNHPP